MRAAKNHLRVPGHRQALAPTLSPQPRKQFIAVKIIVRRRQMALDCECSTSAVCLASLALKDFFRDWKYQNSVTGAVMPEAWAEVEHWCGGVEGDYGPDIADAVTARREREQSTPYERLKMHSY